MAKGRKTGGKDWVPGQSGNPKGRGVYPKELRELRAMNRIGLASAVCEMIHMTEDDLDYMLDENTAPAYHKMLAKVMKKAISQGDQHRVNFIFEQAFGKLKEVMEVDGGMNIHAAIVKLINDKNKGGQNGNKEG